LAQAFSFAGSVAVADAVDTGEAGSLDVGHGVANQCAFPWLGIKCVYGLGDQVRAGLEKGGVVTGSCDDETDPVVQAVAGQVGMDGAG
jgi:hypothetical protein